ncbi:hypothetical protein PIB30_067420 [Stylosanthes scabra]|uniref:Uncharacterized protein n=1 Tax=Stylosanthes scabra TaxID=79078 RepID=A0ABU6YLD3_9FABA|nr:hypothetical protein [Stylosanthes scabra]
MFSPKMTLRSSPPTKSSSTSSPAWFSALLPALPSPSWSPYLHQSTLQHRWRPHHTGEVGLRQTPILKPSPRNSSCHHHLEASLLRTTTMAAATILGCNLSDSTRFPSMMPTRSKTHRPSMFGGSESYVAGDKVLSSQVTPETLSVVDAFCCWGIHCVFDRAELWTLLSLNVEEGLVGILLRRLFRDRLVCHRKSSIRTLKDGVSVYGCVATSPRGTAQPVGVREMRRYSLCLEELYYDIRSRH